GSSSRTSPTCATCRGRRCRAAGMANQAAAAHQRSVTTMGKTIAEALREEGELRTSQEMLRLLLEGRFGPLPPELAPRIAATTDRARLKAAVQQVLRLNRLNELQL